MPKFGFTSLAVLALVATTVPAFAAEQVSLTLNRENSVDNNWTLSGSQAPRMVEIDSAAQRWALQLTDASGDQAGFALLNRAIPVSAGIDVTFFQSQWGGSGADGLVFFIKNAADSSTTPGALGGSLGFTFGDTDGLSGALLGLGLDTYGGFGRSGVGDDCESEPGVRFQSRDALTLRGPGQAREGYCHLAEPWVTTDHGAQTYLDANSRMEGARKLRVKVDSTQLVNPRVKVFYEDQLAIDVPLPEQFNGVTNVKLGFTASSGGATNNHEVWGLQTEVANPQLVAGAPALANTGPSNDLAKWFFGGLALMAAGLGLLLRNAVNAAATRKKLSRIN